jgi:hypothetical protein
MCVLLDHRYELRKNVVVKDLGGKPLVMRTAYVCARCGDRS